MMDDGEAIVRVEHVSKVFGRRAEQVVDKERVATRKSEAQRLTLVTNGAL